MKLSLNKNLILLMLAAFVTACGGTKTVKKKRTPSKPIKTSPRSPIEGIGEENPRLPSIKPKKDEPGKNEPKKIYNGKGEPQKTATTTNLSKPVYPQKTTTSPVNESPANFDYACEKQVNQNITIGGHPFYLDRYTTTMWVTILPNGQMGNYTTKLRGGDLSINSAFDYYIQDGVYQLLPQKYLLEGTVETSNGITKIAELNSHEGQGYNVDGKMYDANLDFKNTGACLATYKSERNGLHYSGGYPLLVLPSQPKK